MAAGTRLVAVLAAGRARRFGGGKLDADLAGKRVGRWVLDAVAAAGLPPGIIVTGPVAPLFVEEAQGWKRIVNSRPSAGLARSLALAAWEADRCEAEALLVLLADMPLVTPALLAALTARPAPAATNYGGRRPGVPAQFSQALFGELTKLQGDRGAARLLAQLPGLVLVQGGAGEPA